MIELWKDQAHKKRYLDLLQVLGERAGFNQDDLDAIKDKVLTEPTEESVLTQSNELEKL